MYKTDKRVEFITERSGVGLWTGQLFRFRHVCVRLRGFVEFNTLMRIH